MSSFRRTYLPRFVPCGGQRRPHAARVRSRPPVPSRLFTTSQLTSFRSCFPPSTRAFPAVAGTRQSSAPFLPFYSVAPRRHPRPTRAVCLTTRCSGLATLAAELDIVRRRMKRRLMRQACALGACSWSSQTVVGVLNELRIPVLVEPARHVIEPYAPIQAAYPNARAC